LLICGTAITLSSLPADARDFYVAANGSDWHSGKTMASPWRSLSKVNSHYFQPGDVVHFRRGDVWEERLLLQNAGSPTLPITYADYGVGEKPTIGEVYHMPYLANADWNVIENLRISGFRKHGVEIHDIEHLTIRNCYIFGCKSRGIQADKNCNYLLVEDAEIYDTTDRGTWVTNSDHVTFRRVTASYCGIRSEIVNQNGINLGTGKDIVVEYCVVHDNTNGIDVGGSKDNDVTIRYNLAYRNADSGIVVGHPLGRAFVYGNVTYENNIGILVKSSANAYLYNNTVSKNTVYGLQLSTTGEVVVKNNIVYKNGEPNGFNILCLAPGQTLTSDYNLISDHSFRSLGAAINTHEYHESMTLAEWKASRCGKFDQHSLNLDPMFVDKSNNNFALRKDSPCINAGVDLGVPYNYALLPGSVWPDGVRTGNQGDFSPWEIGAYIYSP